MLLQGGCGTSWDKKIPSVGVKTVIYCPVYGNSTGKFDQGRGINFNTLKKETQFMLNVV